MPVHLTLFPDGPFSFFSPVYNEVEPFINNVQVSLRERTKARARAASSPWLADRGRRMPIFLFLMNKNRTLGPVPLSTLHNQGKIVGGLFSGTGRLLTSSPFLPWE